MDAKLFTKLIFKASGQFGRDGWTQSFLGLSGKFNSSVKLESTSKGIRMLAKMSGYEVKLLTKKSGEGYLFKLNSNIPSFEKLDGTISLEDKPAVSSKIGLKGSRKVSLRLKKNGQFLMSAAWDRETDLSTYFKANLRIKATSFDQSLGLKIDGTLGGNKLEYPYLAMELFTKGSHSNVAVNAEFSMQKFGESDVITISSGVKGTGVWIEWVNYVAEIKATFQTDSASINNSANIECSVKDNTSGDEWSLTLEQSMIDQQTVMRTKGDGMTVQFQASGSLKSPAGSRIPSVTIELINNLAYSDNDLRLTINGKAEMGKMNIRIRDVGFIFNKPSKHFKLGMDAFVEGDSYRLMAEVDSYKNIEVTFNLPEQYHLGKFSLRHRADFKNFNDFKCEMHLTTPWTGEHGLLLKGSPAANGFDVNGR